jgi:hypothetical protein
MMSEKSDIKWHEKFAKASFNKTWDLMEKKDRIEDEDNEMVNNAHSSRYHWGVLVANKKGTPVNLQRGEWQIARVYTLLERKESALHHANLCLKITKDNNIGDFDLGFAYEAIARASALAGNKDDYEKYYKLAVEAGNKIEKKEDRDYFLEELNGGNWFNIK